MKPYLYAALLATAALMPAQQRSFYQQTDLKGQEIGKLTDNVYYARMDDYVSAFMVTPDGIILVEPIGVEMGTWLKAELDKRFHVPVKYVIYSHSHWDHASGGSVYADTARFIGHENMLKNIAMPPAGHAASRPTCARRTPTATAPSSPPKPKALSKPCSACTTRTRTAY